MKNCSIVNKDTKEPKIVYKPDNGDFTTDYLTALTNSVKNTELGYMQNAEFKKVADFPRFPKDTKQGVIQDFIANGMLEPEQIAPNTYRATDATAAELIEDFYITEKLGEGYIRKGNTFTLTQEELESEIIITDANDLNYDQLITKHGSILGKMLFANKLTNKKKERPVKFDEKTLMTAINSFMTKMGISTMSIEEYSKKYELKHGVRPDAKALININERIIALTNGEITLNEITEEIAHFIIEGMDQELISSLLPQLEGTTYYEKFAESYRTAYGNQVKGDVLEEYVRKEILGKMLADFLKDDFQLENQSQAEMNIFQQLRNMIENFINYIVNKKTPNLEKQLQTIFEDVQNRLYNETLDETLTYKPSAIEEMYSLSTDAEILKMVDYMDRLNKKMGGSQSFEKVYSKNVEFTNAAIQLLDRLDKQVRINLNRLEEANAKETLIDNQELIDVEQVLSLRDSFEVATGFITTSKAIPEILRPRLKDVVNTIGSNFSNLNREYQGNKRVEELTIDEILDEANVLGEATRQGLKDELKRNRKDTSWFFRWMGNPTQSSNPLISIFTALVAKMRGMAVIETNKDIASVLKDFVEKGASYMNQFMNGSYIISEKNSKKYDRDVDLFEYEILTDIGFIDKNEINFEQYQEQKSELGKPTLSEDRVRYYEYIWESKKRIAQRPGVTKERIDYVTKEMEKYEALGLTSLSPLFQFLTNQSTERSKYRGRRDLREMLYRQRVEASSIFDGTGSLKKGIVLDNVRNLVGDFIELPSMKGWGIQIDYSDLTPEEGHDASLTYDLIRWSTMFEQPSGDMLTAMDVNFQKEYQQKLKEIQNLPQAEQAKILTEWVKDNVQLNMADTYWDNLEAGIRFNAMRKVNLSLTDRNIMIKAEREISLQSLRKRDIFKRTKSPTDAKEIDSRLLTANDRAEIKAIEAKINEQRKLVEPIFEQAKIAMYDNSKDANISLNNSFYAEFRSTMGKEYEDATIQEIEQFFMRTAPEKIAGLKAVEQGYGKKHPSGSRMGEMFKRLNKKLTVDPANATLSDYKKAYLELNAPSYYRRYDSDPSYAKLASKLNNNGFTINEIKDFVESNIGGSRLIFNGVEVDQMVFRPNFMFATTSEPKISELYEEHLSKKFTNERERYESLRRVLKLDEVNSEYRQDISDILNDNEKLRIYNKILEHKLAKMDKAKVVDSFDVLLLPQIRKTQTDRYVTFFTKGNKIKQLKEGLEEVINHRPDDFENNYLAKRVPLYGYYRLPEADLSTDFISMFANYSYESNLYVERVKNLRVANTLNNKVYEGTYGNKTGENSNYYKILKDMQDIQFYGRTLTATVPVNVLGKEIDIAKVLMYLKNTALGTALKLSPVVAATNATTGLSTYQIAKWVGEDVYTPADDKAMLQLGTMIAGGVSDIGKMVAGNRLNKIGQTFGVFNAVDRLNDTNYGVTGRLLPRIGYSLMEMTNYPLVTRVMLSKLMEMRIIDGQVYTWAKYKNSEMVNNPSKTKAEIKAEFEAASANTIWEMLDEEGEIDVAKLKALGFKGSIENIQIEAMNKIRDMNEEITAQLGSISNPPANYFPLASFFLSLKKWMVIATTKVFGDPGYNLNRDGRSQGMIYSAKSLWDIVQTMKNDHVGIMEAYNRLPPEAKKSMRELYMASFMLTGLLVLSSIALRYADDDDEENNQLLQGAAYLTVRTLQEASSANFGLMNNYYETLQQPIATLQIVQNTAKLFHFGDIGTEVASGKYKGMDKYAASVLKLTPIKNLHTVSSAYTLKTSRESYIHFNTESSVYNILSLIPEVEN